MKPLSRHRIEGHIRFLLRQADPDELPTEVPMSDWLQARVDKAQAQEIYEDIRRTLERFTTPGSGVIIQSKDGTFRRSDGKPLTKADYKWLEGQDPVDKQIAEARANDDEEKLD